MSEAGEADVPPVFIPPADPSTVHPVTDVSSVAAAIAPSSDLSTPAPVDTQGPIVPADNEKIRKVGSGRPPGVQCKCKCCGALGFYKRSCGKKHQCLIGVCRGGADIPDGNAVTTQGPGLAESAPPATLYQVLCASCGVPLQFALPNHPAYIVCYNCNAKMVIQPMAEQPDSQNPAIAPSEVVGQDATASTLMENPDQTMASTDPNNLGTSPSTMVAAAQLLNSVATTHTTSETAQVGQKRAREEEEPPAQLAHDPPGQPLLSADTLVQIKGETLSQ